MKDRNERIEWYRSYCKHYKPQGAKIKCLSGVDIDKMQRVKTTESGLKWGPCIEGHLLENVCS